MSKRFLKNTSILVLFCFLSSLFAPIVEAAQVVLVKVPGKNIMFDLNTASARHLQELPNIGPKTAAEIVKFRAKSGPFRSVEQLANVPGVGASRLRVIKSAASQGTRSNLQMRTAGNAQAKAQAAQKARVAAAQAQAKAKAQAATRAKQVAAQKAKVAAQQKVAAQNRANAAKVQQQKVAQAKVAQQKIVDAKAAQAKVQAAKVQAAKVQEAKVAQAKVAQAKAQATKTAAQRAQAEMARAKTQAAQQKIAAENRAAKIKAQAQANAKARTAASNTRRAPAAPKATAPVAVRELWVQGPKTRVNINNQNTTGLAGALTRAGFSNAEASQLMNARIQNGKFAEIKSYAELQGRIRLKNGNQAVKFMDGAGRYIKQQPEQVAKKPAKVREVKPRAPSNTKEVAAKQAAARKTANTVEAKRVAQAEAAKVQAQKVAEAKRIAAVDAKKAAALKAKRAQASKPRKVAASRTTPKELADASGSKVKERAAAAKPAAPKTSAPEIASSKGKTVVRVRQGARMAEIDVNGAPNASQLYRRLRSAGVPEVQAKEIAQARIKAPIKNAQDLQARAKSAKDMKVAEAPKRTTSKVRSAASQTKAPAAPSATQAQAQSNLAQIETQYKALASRKVTSELAFDKTVKSLQQTRQAFSKYAANADPAVAAQAKARLAEVDATISKMQGQQRSAAAQSTVNQAKARLNTEIANYTRQANELTATKPAGNAAAIDRQIRGVKQAYDGIYKSLDAQARLSGKVLTPDQILRDPRLAELTKSVNSLQQAKRSVSQQGAAKTQQNAGGKQQLAENKPAAASNTRGNMLDQLKVETEARANQRASATNGASNEANVKSRIAQLESKLLQDGTFRSKADIYKASQASNATGEVKALGNAIEELRGIRSAKASGGASTQVAAEPVATESAARPANTASEPASTAAQGREGVVKGKIAYRMAKILESGQFQTPEQVYEAAQRKDARGDVKKLSNAIEELVGSSRVDLQACKLEYSIVSPK